MLWVFFLSFESLFYIWLEGLYQRMIRKNYSPVCGFPTFPTFLIVSFDVPTFLILLKSYFWYFFYVLYLWYHI